MKELDGVELIRPCDDRKVGERGAIVDGPYRGYCLVEFFVDDKLKWLLYTVPESSLRVFWEYNAGVAQ